MVADIEKREAQRQQVIEAVKAADTDGKPDGWAITCVWEGYTLALVVGKALPGAHPEYTVTARFPLQDIIQHSRGVVGVIRFAVGRLQLDWESFYGHIDLFEPPQVVPPHPLDPEVIS